MKRFGMQVYNIYYELNGGHAPEGITYPESYSFTSDDVTPAQPLLRDIFLAGGRCIDWQMTIRGNYYKM